jgi:small subunit ribosomal protein S18
MAQPKQRGEERSTSRRRPPANAQPRRRNCHFCREKVEEVDYKNLAQLRRYISEKGKIRSRRITGACRRHQVQVGTAVKRAREMALLPYVSGN